MPETCLCGAAWADKSAGSAAVGKSDAWKGSRQQQDGGLEDLLWAKAKECPAHMEFFRQQHPQSKHLKAPPVPPLRQRLKETADKVASLEKQLEAACTRRTEYQKKASDEMEGIARFARERVEALDKLRNLQQEMQNTSENEEPISSDSVEGLQGVAEIMEPYNELQKAEHAVLELRKKFLLVKSKHGAIGGIGVPAAVDASAVQQGVAEQPPHENKDADMLAAEAAAALEEKVEVHDAKRTMEEALARAEQDFQKSKVQKTSGAESGG